MVGRTGDRRRHHPGASLATPLFIAAGLKIAYDVLLYVAFRQVRPPEERLLDKRVE